MTWPSKTNIKKILLVGDIGEWENGRYHIGDESMFYYNYKQLADTWSFDIYATSRSISHWYIPAWREFLRIYFRDETIGILQLLFYSIFFRLFSSSTIPWHIVQTIKIADYILISWGGNLNSIWSGHLYFRFWICFLGRIYWKKIYLSWQTVWPLSIFDKRLLNILIWWCERIMLRDTTYSMQNISCPLTWIMFWLDDAFASFSEHVKKNLEKHCIMKGGEISRIGLSLHEPHDTIYNHDLPSAITLLNTALNWASFCIIPHVFDKYNKGDISFMHQQMPMGIHITLLDYDTINSLATQTTAREEEIIEFYTSKMDYVLTTRYHWAVFAIKHGTIPIMIARNDYEYQKFKWLLDSLHLSHLLSTLIISITWEVSIKQHIQLIVKTHQEIKDTLYRAIENIQPEQLFITSFIKDHA